MKIVNLANVPWDEWGSPGGKFKGSGQQVSIALGSLPNVTPAEGAHPFDLEHGRLQPGLSGCPFHSHSSQWELFVILSGEGTVRHGAEKRSVRAGDVIMHPPGPQAHQLINTGSTDLGYFLVADDPAVDIWHYPDSNKWGYRPAGGIFRKEPHDYYLDEEEGAPAIVEPQPLPAPTPAQIARFTNIDAVPENHLRSPRGKYESFTRDISLAVGGVRDSGPWAAGHPFDLQQRRVPPGAAVCPYHAHTLQWELFVIREGTATVRSGGETHEVRSGDVFIQPPGTPHQIRNSGSEDLVFLVVANNSPAEGIHYPESGKWMLKPQRKVFRMIETDYFDGEE